MAPAAGRTACFARLGARRVAASTGATVVDPSGLPSPRRGPRLLWLILAACWVALGAWAWHVYLQARPPRYVGLPPMPVGKYETVREVTGPISLLLEGGPEVRLGGLAQPAGAAAERARARLTELAAPGTVVYVEMEPRPADGAASPAPASVFLPPPGKPRAIPFPYGESRLLGQVLVQEGLARVNPDEPYRYLNEFLALEDDASRHGRGMWASR